MSWQPWLELLVSWLPMLVLILLFTFYSQRMSRPLAASRQYLAESRQYQADSLAEQRRHNEILEKLLSQHDSRLRKLEDSR